MIIVDDIEQGTPEWQRLRCGIVTASGMDGIFTAGGQRSKSVAYLNTVLAEWLMGKPANDFQSAWMQRGHEVEQEAKDWYSLQTDAPIRRVAFVYRDPSRLVGCSPDGLVGDDGMVEVKCPSPWHHMRYLRDGVLPSDYRVQVMGSLMVTGRQWCDFISYHPDMPPIKIRVPRDEPYITVMDAAVDEFLKLLLRERAALIARGYEPETQA